MRVLSARLNRLTIIARYRAGREASKTNVFLRRPSLPPAGAVGDPTGSPVATTSKSLGTVIRMLAVA
jgi:hypothetical protein